MLPFFSVIVLVAFFLSQLQTIIAFSLKTFTRPVYNIKKAKEANMVVNSDISGNIPDVSGAHPFIPNQIHPSNIIHTMMSYNPTLGNEWSYSELLEYIENDKIAGLSFYENGRGAVAIDTNIESMITPENLHHIRMFPYNFDTLVDMATQHKINVDVYTEPVNQIGNFVNFLFSNSLNILFLIFALNAVRNIFFMNQMGKGNMNDPMSFFKGFTQDDPRIVETSLLNTTFADVAGCDEAKFELMEVVDFLREPDRFVDAGAKIPKGVLLAGSPGTGKTLLARAVAKEANVSFISASGSEFIEMFVGVGASRVRSLFDSARENSPCVVFIDEIDAIGRQRGTGIAGGNDEREQTLNQILTNMDGFSESQGIVVIAATNRIDVLDNALIRPGRFDRKINVPLPDFDGRKQIANVHFKNKKIDGDSVDFNELSSLTTGFSGADIANLANEAAIFSVRSNKTEIDRESILQAYEKMTIGLSSNVPETNDEIVELVSYHETGHALMAALFPEFFDLRKVTINANLGGAGGYTLFTPKEQYQKYASKKFILANLIVALGGRAAEVYLYRKKNYSESSNNKTSSIFKGFQDLDITTGATNDLSQANKIARDYITRYGFGAEFGIYDDSMNDELPNLGRDLAQSSRSVSDTTKYDLDIEVKKLVHFAYESSLQLIHENRNTFEKIVQLLREERTISGSDVKMIRDELCE